MRVLKLAWLGTRTDKGAETAGFFERVMGLRMTRTEADFWMLELPDGSKVEVFGLASPSNRHFTTGPVAGFLVDDFEAAVEDLRRAGVQIVHGPEADEDGNAWVHFKAPDGNLYEITRAPGVSRSS